MRKIPTLFMRNRDTDNRVRDEVDPECQWVIDGEGYATQKHDGTCCMVRDEKLYKRYELRPGKEPPEDFEPAGDVDENTGKQQGWVPVGKGPEDKWHREAMETLVYRSGPENNKDGTYELCGPRVQGNPEGFERHVLVQHGSISMKAPRSFDELRDWLAERDIEGIVWHHPDGRMCKIKKRDFGLKRKPDNQAQGE